MKTNYHTHIYLCRHATGTVEDYVLEAVKKGYTEIGISDHGPQTEELHRKFKSRRMTLDEYYNKYIPEINEVKLKYQDKIKVLKSIEIEYYNEMKEFYFKFKEELDYLVLGQHLVQIDNNTYNLYDIKYTEVEIKKYAQTISEALETKCFKVLAHPEIFLVSYGKWDEVSIEVSKQIILSAIKNNVYLEFNANGLRGKKIKIDDSVYSNTTLRGFKTNYVYPRLEFWQLVKDYNYDKILINDDCHKVENLGDEYTEEARKITKMLNLNVATKLELDN